MGKQKRQKTGFTIVELAVIISVIGILAAITVVGYGAWQKRTTENTVKSDLLNVAAAMETARNFSNTYPSTFPSTFTPSSNVVLEMVATLPGNFCINAYSIKDLSVRMSIYSAESQQPRDYLCTGITTGAVIGGVVPAAPTGVNIAPSFANWTLAGTATYDSSTGVITLGTNGTATSPKVRVNGVTGMRVNALFNATIQSPNASLMPSGGWHSSSAYFTSNGTTPATNTAGNQTNGCARAITLGAGSWNASATNCTFVLGNNVEYARIALISSASGNSSPDLKVKDLTFILY